MDDEAVKIISHQTTKMFQTLPRVLAVSEKKQTANIKLLQNDHIWPKTDFGDLSNKIMRNEALRELTVKDSC